MTSNLEEAGSSPDLIAQKGNLDCFQVVHRFQASVSKMLFYLLSQKAQCLLKSLCYRTFWVVAIVTAWNVPPGYMVSEILRLLTCTEMDI